MRSFLVGLSVLGVAVFLALGVWQVQRLGWKTGLIAAVEARLAAPPEAARPEGGAEYSRVTLAGRFDPRQVLVKAVTERGAGHWVMTPLHGAGWTLWVNRGFLPEGTEPPAPPGQAEVTGLLRASQPGGGFLRANDPEGGRWFSRDVAVLSASLGIEAAPWFLDAQSGATPSGAALPVQGLTVVAFANNHLQYALTWFVMAALLAGAAWWNLGRGAQTS